MKRLASLALALAATSVHAMIPCFGYVLFLPPAERKALFEQTYERMAALGPEAPHYQTWFVPLHDEPAKALQDGEMPGPFEWALHFLDVRPSPAFPWLEHPCLAARMGYPAPTRGTLDESEKTLSDDERETADLLLAEGWDFRARRERQGQRNPEGEITRLTSLGGRHGRDGMRMRERRTIEFKRLHGPAADSATIRNRTTGSMAGGGQSPYLILDARGSGLVEAEAIRGAMRVRGHIRSHRERAFEWRLFELRIVGDGFDHQFLFSTEATLREQSARDMGGIINARDEDGDRPLPPLP